MDKEKLLDDLNSGLQALIREDIRFPVAEELPPLYQQDDFAWARREIQPLGGLYLRVGDLIKVDIFNTITNVRIRIVGRVLRPDGTVVLLNAEVAPTDDRLANTFRIATVNGFLLGLTATTINSTSAFPGTIYCRASIVSNQAQDLETSSLFGGYLAFHRPLSWPPGGIEQPGSGPGLLRTHTGAAPAVGSDFTMVFAQHFRFSIIAVTAALTTSATVANRSAELVISDGSVNLVRMAPESLQAASLTRTYHASRAPLAPATVGSVFRWSLPSDLKVGSAVIVSSSTANLQAGDQWGVQVIYAEDWVTP